ncbi:MAG: alanine/glycine:cation symporter family protein [Pseudomonadota bacterium]
MVSGFIFYSVPLFGTDVPLIVLWLIGGGLFFTLYLKLLNLRGFAHAWSLLFGKPGTDARGEISQFQALTTAVSGTVGIGNIGGVAVAITMGGPGAAFWLMLAGFLGMATKAAECTLGQRYRQIEGNGEVGGGPMYYLSAGLGERGMPGLGRWLGRFYAASMVVGCLGIGNMFQSNQAAAIINEVSGGLFDGRAWLIGLVLAVLVGAVILGGLKSIAHTAERLVPSMALLYLGLGLLVLLAQYERLPGAISLIFSSAFNLEAGAGGLLGAMIVGFRRAAFSNEAGLGSASIAHSAARTAYPAAEGYVALLEPFIDTVVICSLTALIITTTVYDPALAQESGLDGIELTTRAFVSTFSWSALPLALVAVLFAFSTMLAWSYYGLKSFMFLLGPRATSQTVWSLGFKLMFLAFVVLGASMNLAAVVDLSDALVFVVAIPNLIGLYLLAPVVREEISRYDAARQSAAN